MWLAASQETLHRLIDERERSAGEAAARDFDADPLDDAVDPALGIYAKVRRRDRRATWGRLSTRWSARQFHSATTPRPLRISARIGVRSGWIPREIGQRIGQRSGWA